MSIPICRSPSSWGRRPALAMLVTALAGLTLAASTPKFYDDDPIWQEPITQDVKNATRYEPDLAYQSLENLFAKPGDKVLGQRAKNINTVDEVPDGPFFVNRAGRMTLTPAIVARASNTTNGPAPGKWTVVVGQERRRLARIHDSRHAPSSSGSSSSIRPAGRRWRPATEVVAAKLFWAVGYHTAEYHIDRLVPSNLEIDAEHQDHAAGRDAAADAVRATSRGCSRAPIRARMARIGSSPARRRQAVRWAASLSTALARTIRTTSSRMSIAASCEATSCLPRG